MQNIMTMYKKWLYAKTLSQLAQNCTIEEIEEVYQLIKKDITLPSTECSFWAYFFDNLEIDIAKEVRDNVIRRDH